ncbi:MAG TPA: hypothetical protein VEI97_06050 [bacterium]|nr:hypothetical protein [bacterium]
MRKSTTSGLCLLPVLLVGLLMAGCTGTGAGPVAPEVDGEPLTNPNPSGPVDGSFIPYLPDPDQNDVDEPIPTAPDPGLTAQDGKTGHPDTGGPWLGEDPSGPVVLFESDTPAEGGVIVTIDNGNGGRTEILDSTSGTPVSPGLGGDRGPSVDERGLVSVPVIPGFGGISVYLSFTVLDANGNPTGTSHGITLPPGWTLDLGENMGEEGQMF